MTDPTHTPPEHRATEEAPSAAAQLFDLRTIIAILFGFYGVVLTIMGLISPSPDEVAKTAGIDINLWSGIVMIVVAVGFVVWARTRPLAPPSRGGDDADRPPAAH